MYTGSWLCRTLLIFIKGVCKHHMGHGIIWQLISVNFLYQYMHWSYLKKLLPHERVKTRGWKIFIVRVWKHPLTFPPKLLLFYKYLFFFTEKEAKLFKVPSLILPSACWSAHKATCKYFNGGLSCVHFWTCLPVQLFTTSCSLEILWVFFGLPLFLAGLSSSHRNHSIVLLHIFSTYLWVVLVLRYSSSFE